MAHYPAMKLELSLQKIVGVSTVHSPCIFISNIPMTHLCCFVPSPRRRCQDQPRAVPFFLFCGDVLATGYTIILYIYNYTPGINVQNYNFRSVHPTETE